jgi:hypothetical protein
MAKRKPKPKRRCQAKTKAGRRCRATPRRDTGLCNAHSPKKVQESAGFGGAQEGAGRPRLPGPHELARKLVEENIRHVVRPFFRTLGLDLEEDGSVTECGGAIKFQWAGVNEPALEMVDLGAQILAAEKLLDRIYGKPRQQLEHVGDPERPVEFDGELRLDAETREAISGLLTRRAPPRED